MEWDNEIIERMIELKLQSELFKKELSSKKKY